MLSKNLLLSGVALTVLGMVGVQASADVTSPTKSTTSVVFVAGDDKPIKPTNPLNPGEDGGEVEGEEGNKGTGNKGPLSLDYVSNFNFGSPKIKSDAAIYNVTNKTPYIQVSDVRGTDAGWVLKATADKFVSEDKSELNGAFISLGAGNMIPSSGSTAGKPTSKQVDLTPGEEKTVIQADKNQGQGLWIEQLFDAENVTTDNKTVQLHVPAGSAKAKSYSSTINWSLQDVPTKE